MNAAYFAGLGVSAVLCAMLFAWKLRRAGLKMQTAWTGLPLSIVLGLVCSKVGYFLLELRDQYTRYGMAGLLTDVPSEFSFVSGCAGVLLAVMLAARLSGQRIPQVLDAFAPCGALMAALARACEGLLRPMSLVGMGEFVENEALHGFPVSVEVPQLYSWFYAVFMLEAVCALVCAVFSFVLSHRGRFADGRVFLHTVFFLALPQVFCERLLNQCMRWGFVRIEQLLCAVVAFVVILYPCICRMKHAGLRALIPAGVTLLFMVVIIDMEFTLDNKPFFGLEMPVMACQVVTILVLIGMAAMSLTAYHRLNRAEEK